MFHTKIIATESNWDHISLFNSPDSLNGDIGFKLDSVYDTILAALRSNKHPDNIITLPSIVHSFIEADEIWLSQTKYSTFSNLFYTLNTGTHFYFINLGLIVQCPQLIRIFYC